MCPESITHLATGGLGEPQGPFVHKRMLHVEVIGVVENGNGITLSLGDGGGVLIGHSRSTILSNGGHGEWMWSGKRGDNRRKVGGARISGKAQIGFSHKEGKNPKPGSSQQ